MLRTLTVIAMVCTMIYSVMHVAGSQPYENIVPCTTDMDCMEKNPHIEFSLESD